MTIVTFEVFSGGTVSIETDRCPDCTTKACISACSDRYINGPLVLEGDIPVLRFSLEEIKRGACSECLGCELACQTHGLDQIRISLPMPELDAYLSKLEVIPIFRRSGREHLDR